jgi:hypothetical protein
VWGGVAGRVTKGADLLTEKPLCGPG